MPNSPSEMKFENYRPRPPQPEPKVKVKTPRKARSKGRVWFLFFILICCIALLIGLEVKTSFYQAKYINQHAKTLTYELDNSPSTAVIYPSYGPFDERHGYSKLPQYIDRLLQRNFQVTQQVAFSPALLEYAQLGFFPPYHEKAQSGLTLLDCRNTDLYEFAYPKRVYQDDDKIPNEIVNTLLFIENRELWTTEDKLNPVIDWPRFVVAGMSQIAEMVGMNVSTAGGSTLATQIEKFRHSSQGLTLSIKDKLLQIGSASVRVYQQGENTEPARKRIVQDYLNTVPLSSAPNHGEVHGIGDGLWAWFGTDFDTANKLLASPQIKGNAAKRGQVFRQVVALMIAQRRPSYYLLQGHEDLENLVDSHIRLLGQYYLIDRGLRDAALAQKLQFRVTKPQRNTQSGADKGVNTVRIRTAGMLNVGLYDLDRLDLTVNSSLHSDLQQQVSHYLRSLAQVSTAEQVGLLGERLLEPSQLQNVLYSFTLYERTDTANRVRVQTDSTDQPFDINEGSKLELGSTAKLRVMATYLEIIAEIHEKYSKKHGIELESIIIEPRDHLTRWAIDYLIVNPDRRLDRMLDAALQREYSASTSEQFFTGGGLHVFNNFKKSEDVKTPTLYQALQDSINLPFVRLMRDIVNYSSSMQNEGNMAQLLRNDKDPRRDEYLRVFADREGNTFVTKFYRKYKKVAANERFGMFFDGLSQSEQQLTSAYRYLLPDESMSAFKAFLQQRLPQVSYTDGRIKSLYNKYGPDKYNLPDQGYIARVHPLELWVLDYLNHNPDANLNDVKQASEAQRQEVYRWLFRTRHKNARDVRVQVMLEVEAFLDIHQRWARLGYPFDAMVPSLGSALGSSGDRPAALAELMGIIQNDGYRLPTVRINQLHFAADTPYEVTLQNQNTQGERVMRHEVAQALKAALANVVQNGTARRLKGIFTDEKGEMLAIGGKTGTGDNRIVTQMQQGKKVATTAMNRTATFVFYLGDKYFGTLTAFVPGSKSDDFSFTSALPLQVMKGMMPILSPYVKTEQGMCVVNE
ncbi:transglycosylase domain-containing protein [Shewanella septentrionalis]|uniref:peptidoglycan glycosyltransferase n=1 Tax=Shewanella septentrionalis TaxID=2952223 RepID=A0A9X2WR85_9GAMM|nr:transglycosylase domain-containing protein [Shewanella septentrionalis]MCT7943799.1 transglycosylase domain-containing protein [Shewanella septentrionalis]